MANTYAYDALGRRESRGQSGSAFAQASADAFTYNSRNEVTGSTNALLTQRTFAYSYDNMGNRLQSTLDTTPTAYTTNALNQYSAIEEGALRECRYDLDGNLEFDGQRSYAWDGENRLIKVNLLGNHPEERNEVTYAYDYEGRRVRKTRTDHVLGAEGWESTQLADDRYVYDGWNLIAEYDAQASHTLRRTYTWGLDLSLTLQGAGGVGGLLRSETHAPNAHQGAYYYTYDANGNVTQVLDTTGTLAAHYEYSPFGETVYQSGGYANENPFRFSTKYTDNESGLLYYGYRYYDAETGRWLNRDPIGERGGLNLYGFVGNDGVNAWDLLGLSTADMVQNNPHYQQVMPDSKGDDGSYHKDNDPTKIGEFLMDPGPSCFNEGWFRHCVNSCRLQLYLNSAGGAPLLNSVATQLSAQAAGNDLPGNPDRDPGDIAANQQGVDNANSNGPSDSCVNTCRSQWFAKRARECCPERWIFKKTDSQCRPCGS